MSKYLTYYGSRLPAHQENFGGILDMLNPVTAYNYYAKKGISSLPGDFKQELKDYKQVRETISNRPNVLRKSALKIRDVSFDQSKSKTLHNYKGAVWSNVLSQTPTSAAEAFAIVAALYYIAGNIYNSQELIGVGDQFIKRSERAPSDKNVKKALKALNSGVKQLNSDAIKAGVVPAWYNIIGQIKKAWTGDKAMNDLGKLTKQMSSSSEIKFAETMRAERLEDESPLGNLIGIFTVAIGGIVLFFTAPYWLPTAGRIGAKVVSIVPKVGAKIGGLIGKGAKGAGKLASKSATSMGKAAKSATTDTFQDIGKNLAQKAESSIKDFDVKGFTENIQSLVKEMNIQGKAPSQAVLIQSQEVQNMLSKFLKNQSQENEVATKQEMKKLLLQILSEMKNQEQV